MTNEQTSTLVLKDPMGNYYLVPVATLEQRQVPPEHTAEIERLIAAHDDVQGHVPLFVLVATLFGLGAQIGIGFGDRFEFGGNRAERPL